MIPKSCKGWSVSLPKTHFKNIPQNDENMTQKVLQNEVPKTEFFVFFRGLGPGVPHGGPKEPPRVPIVSLKIPKWSTKVFTN